ncbi:c-type cytochrome [Nitratifractor sp.]
MTMKRSIALGIVASALILGGCSEETKKNVQQAAQSASQDATRAVEQAKANMPQNMEEAKKKAAEALEAAKAKSAEVAQQAAQKGQEVMQETAQKAQEVAEAAKVKSQELTKKAIELTAQAAGAVEKTAHQVKAALSPVEQGKALFAKCAGCHGSDGKTPALGKSPAIAGQSKEDLVSKIEGYKAGTRNAYGMGNVMHAQVESYNEEQIEALSAYISSLK